MTGPVGSTYTPRLGLTVHGMDDELDAMRDNWNKLDTSYTGVIWVTPGTVPDSDILFNGAIVAERETGKVWQAQKNNNGIFEKKWIKYPWCYVGNTLNYPMPNSNFVELGRYGVVNFDALSSINSVSDAPGSDITVPITGLYSGVYAARFESAGNLNAGHRQVSLLINGAIEANNYQTFKVPNPNWGWITDHYVPFNRKFEAGTSVILSVRQNSGVTLNVSASFSIALVRPL